MSDKKLEELLKARNADGDVSQKGIASYGTILRDTMSNIDDEEYEELCKSVSMAKEGEGKAGDGSDEIIRDRILTFKGSDETVDRYGDIVRVDGWKLDAYKMNPVFLLHHDQRSVPVGRTLKVWKAKGLSDSPNGKALLFRVYFPTAEVSADSDVAFKLFKAKILNATSVGFRAKKYNDPTSPEERKSIGLGPYGVEFIEQELYELSGVTVPANPNALQVLGLDEASFRKGGHIPGIKKEISSTDSGIGHDLLKILEDIGLAGQLASIALAVGEVKAAVQKLEENITSSAKAAENKGNLDVAGHQATPENGGDAQVNSKSLYNLLSESLGL